MSETLEQISERILDEVSQDAWLCGYDAVEEFARRLVAALQSDGWQMVPKEPTEEMISEAFKATRYNEGVGSGADLYKALLAAAPEYGK